MKTEELAQKLKQDFAKYLLVALSLNPSASHAANSRSDDVKETPTTLTQDTQSTQMQIVDENTESDRVGNWTDKDLCVMHEIDTEYQRPEVLPLPSRPQDFIPHGKVHVLPYEDVAITRADGTKAYALAKVDMHDGSITMSQQNKNAIKSTSSPESSKYLSGDVTTQQAIFFHEVNHSKDQIYLHTNAKYHTPVNAARFSNLSENVSYSVSYLSSAYMYQNLKNNNCETVQINGQDVPVESILDTYPNLRQTYEKYGLDINNPQSIRRYVELGIKYKNDEKEAYDKQAYSNFVNARELAKEKPYDARIAEAKTEDKDFEEISHLMTSKVYIGQNTCVDLSSCYDILNDMSKQDVCNLVERQSNGSDHVVPSQNIVAIDNYLTSLNIDNDEKSDYIAEQFFLILDNDANVDVTLKNLMLQSQNIQQERQTQLKTTDQETQLAQTQAKTPQKTLSYYDAMAMINGGR